MATALTPQPARVVSQGSGGGGRGLGFRILDLEFRV